MATEILPKKMTTSKYYPTQKIPVRNDVFHYANLHFFRIAYLCNVIQQIKRCGPNWTKTMLINLNVYWLFANNKTEKTHNVPLKKLLDLGYSM